MAHADSVVKGAIGRRETLLALFGVMSKLDRRERALLKCLKCLRLLTFDPALLQPLQVCSLPHSHLVSVHTLTWTVVKELVTGKFVWRNRVLLKSLRLLNVYPALLQPWQVPCALTALCHASSL